MKILIPPGEIDINPQIAISFGDGQRCSLLGQVCAALVRSYTHITRSPAKKRPPSRIFAPTHFPRRKRGNGSAATNSWTGEREGKKKKKMDFVVRSFFPSLSRRPFCEEADARSLPLSRSLVSRVRA